jgi:methylglutaconyl-CoA hydratase
MTQRTAEGVLVRRRGDAGAWEVVIDRPHKRNALTPAMMDAAAQAVEQLFTDAKVIVLAGAGGAFSAGADLDSLADELGVSPLTRYAVRAPLDRLFDALSRCPVPVIAQVEGAALGGALGMIALSTYAVATPSAILALPEAGLGMFPAAIVPLLVARVGVNHAVRWALTAERIPVAEALASGLVDAVVDEAEIGAHVDALAASLTEKDADVLRAGIELRRLLLEDQRAAAGRDMGRLMSAVFWRDEPIAGALERRSRRRAPSQ